MVQTRRDNTYGMYKMWEVDIEDVRCVLLATATQSQLQAGVVLQASQLMEQICCVILKID